MAFEQLTEQSGVMPEKLIALKLSGMTWLDRRWLLKNMPRALRTTVEHELTLLKQMGVTDPAPIIAALESAKTPEPGNSSPLDNSGFSSGLRAQLANMSAPDHGLPINLHLTVTDYLNGEKS